MSEAWHFEILMPFEKEARFHTFKSFQLKRLHVVAMCHWTNLNVSIVIIFIHLLTLSISFTPHLCAKLLTCK